MPTLDDNIAAKLAEAARSGELASAQSYGRPMPEAEGWQQTPEALRMPFKILKDAGVPPPEIALFHERARLRAAADAATDPAARRALQQALSDLEQKLSLRLAALRRSGAV
jgi:hypothetical protein